MASPILKFKRGNFSNLPGLQAGEPALTVDKFDLYVGIDSTTNNNKFIGSQRFWTLETATTGSGVNLVEGSNNGANHLTLKAPASITSNQTYTFPAAAVNNGILMSDGSGNLTWDTGGGFAAGSFGIAALDIDGGTDIGADLVDADEIIVDDGGGGTNRKSDLSRVKKYIYSAASGDATASDSGAITLAASGVSAGTVGSSTAIPILTIDAKGRVTNTSSTAIDQTSIAQGNSSVTVADTGTGTATVTIDGATHSTFAAAGVTLSQGAFVGNLTGNVTGNTNGTHTGSLSGATAGTLPLLAVDIDGGTATSTVADSDIMIIDDGANGTNRKVTATVLKDYFLGGGAGANFTAINVTGISTLAQADTTTLKVSGISTFTGQTNHSTINASSTVTGTAFHTGAEGSAIRVTSNTISGPATITLDPAGVGDNTGKVVIAGDFQVDGTTTTVNSTTMTVDDKNLELGTGAANDAAADGGGITIVSGTGNKTFNFQATGDNLGSSENLNIASGKDYKVNNVSVLNATTLGSSVVASSLTSVGNLTTLDVTGATNLNATTQSTSNTTGALIVDGGVGIAKNVHIGGTLDVDGQLTSAAPLRNSTGAGLIPGVGVITATSDAGLVTAFKFRGNGLENFIVEDGVADVVLSGVAATTFTTSQTTTATEGQTAITVSAGYSQGFMDVYLNGIRLITGTDYTQTNATTVTLASGATAGDEIETVAWKSLGDIVSIQSLQTAADLTVTGVATATGGFVGNITGDITGSGANLTAGTVPLASLDIDGGTATTTLADADLFIVDDGANGTNRKVTFEKLSESILGGSGGATFAAVNVTGIGTFGGVLDSNGGANISGGDGLVASSAKVSDLTAGRVVLAGTSGEIEDSGNLTFDGSTLAVTGAATVSTNLTISGNLTVNGTTTQINTVNTTIEDTLLELQKVDGGNLGSDTNKDVGIVMNYYDGSAKKASMFWDDSAGRFAFGSVVTETTGVLGSVTYGGVEMGSLYLNDCAGASQVISCSGTTRSLENITIDGGAF